jgi:hypothetical protein
MKRYEEITKAKSPTQKEGLQPALPFNSVEHEQNYGNCRKQQGPKIERRHGQSSNHADRHGKTSAPPAFHPAQIFNQSNHHLGNSPAKVPMGNCWLARHVF